MKTKSDFSDLIPRFLSAVVLLVIGFWALSSGGIILSLFLAVAAGLMGWETSRMHNDTIEIPIALGVLLGIITLAPSYFPAMWGNLLIVVTFGLALVLHRQWPTVVSAGIAIAVACVSLQIIRNDWGLEWTLFLISVVIASDVGGYFAGKLIGGPKILPRISPKKTWSGTLGGWALAACVGLWAIDADLGGSGLLVVAVLLAIAAQTGDLLESLMKRRAGVKDSSNLIPGHGGLLDRFDGLVGAACALGLLMALGGADILGNL